MSGCQHAQMKLLYTERHNYTFRPLVKAVLQGRYGAADIVTDLGSRDKLTADGIVNTNLRHVPMYLLPPGTTADAAKRLSRPDILIAMKNQSTKKWKVILVECKYCRDTSPEDRRESAMEQDKTLSSDYLHKSEIVESVELVVILVGVGGTIYKSMIKDLEKLGIEQTPGERVAKEIHLRVVDQAHVVWSSRKHLEREHLMRNTANSDPRFRKNK